MNRKKYEYKYWWNQSSLRRVQERIEFLESWFFSFDNREGQKFAFCFRMVALTCFKWFSFKYTIFEDISPIYTSRPLVWLSRSLFDVWLSHRSMLELHPFWWWLILRCKVTKPTLIHCYFKNNYYCPITVLRDSCCSLFLTQIRFYQQNWLVTNYSIFRNNSKHCEVWEVTQSSSD